MTIPIYDITILPCITYPMKNTQEQTKKYLGGRAVTGSVTADINIIAESDAELASLYDFWVTDCNYGLEPFLIPLPVFGRGVDSVTPTLLVKFNSDFATDKEPGKCQSNIKLIVLGTIDYIVDDLGNYVVSDTGEYVVSDTISINNKEITWQ